MLGELGLDPIGHTRVQVTPIVGFDEPCGRGRRHERAGDVLHGKPLLSRADAIDFDIQRRVVERLSILQIAQARNLGELDANLFGVRTVHGEIESPERPLPHRRPRSEAHHHG